MFKQRVKKEKRKRVRLDEDESSEDINLDVLQELKEDLKHRERLKLQRTPLVTKNIETSVTNTLDGQFTVQSNMTTADQFNKIMNNYVETRLKEKYMVNDTCEKEPKLTEEQELYRIPDHLREKMNLPDKAPEGGIITWNTGIAEVELPQEMHDNMIQATKEALVHQQHYEQTMSKSSALPTNVSANYKKHKHDYINDLKQRSHEEQHAKNFHLVNPNNATDDQIMRKFRHEQSKRKRY
ncbi:hypothetical protein THRCLA_07118 [Thraustotheca clavata]|uniref:Hepatocellular carcinoma-associated antigen 59 n=1 Tax=Thraustotheca clavata TaxID=74557 RepID=A0A1V9ZG12_9STRA|nr:hypothetical protein THRCLA_07118 [Thraustotheca clavata]